MYDYIVIGAGVVGAFIAKELSQYEIKVLVLDKENDIANETSMANSAVIHAGYDPIPGSLKAKLNVEGNKLHHELANYYQVPIYPIGSLTVATNQTEYQYLIELVERAKQNRVEVQLLSGVEAKQKEPALNDDVIGALFAPSAAIMYPWTISYAVFDHAISNGVELKLGQEVMDVKHEHDFYEVKTQDAVFKTKSVINCAGVFGTTIQAMLEPCEIAITPRKGEYYVLQRAANAYINHVVFPVPSKKGKGVLMVPVSERELLVGPTSEVVEDCDDVSTTEIGLATIKTEINKTMKDVPFHRIMRSFAGLRATPSSHDFYIQESKLHPHLFHCIGIESPGFASAPAIAKYLGQIANFNGHTKKQDYKEYQPTTRIHPMTAKERQVAANSDGDYGKIICRCETISKKEIEEALQGNVAATTIKGIKKRVRPGSGVCQGGFCEPEIVKMIANHYGVAMTEVLYDKTDSHMLVARAKGEGHENI